MHAQPVKPPSSLSPTYSPPAHPTQRTTLQSCSSPPWAPHSRSTRTEITTSANFPSIPPPTQTIHQNHPTPPITKEEKKSKTKRKDRTGLTVSLSAKISLISNILREMCATGSPPKVTLAERSYQVPRTSSSMSLPSDSFLKVTVDALVRTEVGG